MMDTRIIALLAGVVGATFGVAAVAAGSPALGAAAGAAALGAGIVALVGDRAASGRRLAEVEARLVERDRLLDSARGERDEARRRAQELEERAVEAAAQPAERDHLVEPVSQLFSEAYFRVALDSRLASARRHLRPVAVGLLEVSEGSGPQLRGETPPDRVAAAIRETVREADIACRLDDGTFAVVLEDTPENGAVWTVERIRRNLVSRFGEHTMWAGVACYPAHAFTTEELLAQSRGALSAAKDWNQDRIEVAVSD
jgi:PleD family two-component response regulator